MLGCFEQIRSLFTSNEHRGGAGAEPGCGKGGVIAEGSLWASTFSLLFEGKVTDSQALLKPDL